MLSLLIADSSSRSRLNNFRVPVGSRVHLTFERRIAENENANDSFNEDEIILTAPNTPLNNVSSPQDDSKSNDVNDNLRYNDNDYNNSNDSGNVNNIYGSGYDGYAAAYEDLPSSEIKNAGIKDDIVHAANNNNYNYNSFDGNNESKEVDEDSSNANNINNEQSNSAVSPTHTPAENIEMQSELEIKR